MPGPTTDSARRIGPADVVVLLLLLLALAWYVQAQVDLGGRPEEDAAMLLRYSEHLADGHGIVWNVGERPLDGGTDFLFLLAVAGVHRAGVPLESAARGIGLVAHALTVAVIFLSVRTLFGAGPGLALVSAAFFAAGPGLRHLAACYGTPLFTLAAAVTWLLACRLAMAAPGKEARPAMAFAVSALVTGLARPEGVFLGGFFLLALVAYRGGDGARRIVGVFVLLFLTLGLAYFLWRWHYFGHPLPNPFYKKGAGILHWHSLRQAWRDTARLGPPFLALVGVGLLLRPTRRFAAFALFPVLAFACLWVLIADETNYVMRFRHPILPVLLVAWVPVWQELARRLPWVPWRAAAPAGAGWAVAIAVAAGFFGFQHLRYRSVAQHQMGLHEAALVLRDYAPWNYGLVTTEAGLLPLYSTWRALDAWGLNDSFIAHNGEITAEYLDRFRPEVIVFHAFFSPRTAQEGERIENRSLGKPWYRMVRTLKQYAEKNDYELAAVFGRDPYDTHWYYVRRGFPRSEEIVARIRALDYYWDGAPTTDFAQPGS